MRIYVYVPEENFADEIFRERLCFDLHEAMQEYY